MCLVRVRDGQERKFSQSNKPKSGGSPTEGVYSLTSIEITLASFNVFFCLFFPFQVFLARFDPPACACLPYAPESRQLFFPFSLCKLVCLDTCDRHVCTALERESMELKLPPTEIITLRCCSSRRRCMAPKSLLTHNPGGGSGLPSVLPPPMDCCVDRVSTARNLLFFLYIFSLTTVELF